MVRLKQIDLLRAAAVLLVVASHLTWSPFLVRIGWVGVDLFFVLSGFLVSGLLFREYQLTGSMRLGRFLLRRGFKIYPAYYLLLLATILYYGRDLSWSRIWPDLIFAQSYFPGTWGHFWSLAVEEHFYILLPLTLLFFASRNSGPDPFRRVPLVFAALAVICLVLRLIPALSGEPYSFERHIAPSHLRMDSLGFGVLLSYLHHFRRAALDRLHARAGSLLLPLSVVLVSPVLYLNREGVFMRTAGLSLLYLGFGGMLLLALRHAPHERFPLRILTRIGEASYTIYLIHMPVAFWVLSFHTRIGRDAAYFLYIAVALLAGVILSRAIEVPVLRLRNQYFPALTDARHRTAAVSRSLPQQP